ncbi:von Willebrand factor D and EGF domain-containing protein-like [Mercenaria mercenaria]|uniref:von Willebrand factor D and EGF domain-containing protein-like n=1 Tax=Mercenaria mercenaria TaxID=6596 RepID=UPI00234F2359|nr:von Willebrand factor D and EGF domain-containing protein-like [Mercenaria mercenaria]
MTERIRHSLISAYSKFCNFVFFVYYYVEARPFKSPDFVSQWYYINAAPGQDRIDVYHHLRVTPAFVQVQVRSDSANNNGYIFPGIGLVPRDDDEAIPYAAVSYIYNERMVTISAMSENNNNRGRVLYTENSKYWDGPNADDSYDGYVRVRAWKLSSFPKPDFKIDGFNITSSCAVETDCFYEKIHDLKEYPSMVIVRTKLSNPNSDFDGFMSDAVGSGQVTYDNDIGKHSGYVLFGFDMESIRVWTDSSKGRNIFNGADGSAFDTEFTSGQLEIYAWKQATLTPTSVETIQLGVVPGSEFDNDKHIAIVSPTENIVINLWAEATDGPNAGFRFVATGSLAFLDGPKSSCSYGGLTYAYTNSSIRTWKPGSANIGQIIRIPRIYGGGLYSQCSNQAVSKAHIWIPQVSTLHANCSGSGDCFDKKSDCINKTCQCEDGYYVDDDICQKYLTCEEEVPLLPDLGVRARNYFIDQSSTSDGIVDDKFLKLSWYNVSTSKGNYQMPDSTTVPSPFSCGSRNQIYVNGTHITVGNLTKNPVELTVCYKNCTETSLVSVRMCQGSLQYQLGRLPFEKAAYCFDPPELQGIRDFDPVPAVDRFTLNLDVELHFMHARRQYRPYLTFNCTPSAVLPESLYYTTYWYLGPTLFTAIGPSRRIENLTEEMLKQKKQGLDIYMSCGVRVSASQTGLLTNLTKSPENFYGIKVHKPTVYIKKGQNAKVTIEPTAPIGCIYGENEHFKETCYQDFRMISPEGEGCDLTGLIDVERSRRCGGRMKACKFNETCTVGENYSYEVTTKDRNFADGHQFRLPLRLAGDLHPIWRNHRIKDIMIYVTDNDAYKYKQCYSHVDPHMQTVDGYHFDNQYEGEFILYRNIKYGIEVQEKTTVCNHGRAYCACAVAIRAGADIFLINTCGRLKFIGFTSCSDGGILDVRKRSSLRYQVFTPIGTYINLQMRPHPGYDNLINTDIYMAPKDLGNTEGLCGYFDNIKTNDLRKRNNKSIPIDLRRGGHRHLDFSQEWRRKSFETSYLVLNPGQISSWHAEQRDMFCYCEKALTDFQGNKSMEATAKCSASLYAGCEENKRSVTKQLCKKFHKRKRRSLERSSVELERRQQLVYKEPFQEHKRNDRAVNVNNITENEAGKLCADVINSQPAVKTFGHRLKGISPQQAVAECTFDVVEGNDKSWADVYPSVLDQVIEANNERDPEYVKANADEVASFNLQSCLRNCTGHGNCSIEGECMCINGYHGPDCSIDENDRLRIDDIEGGGLCDTDNGMEACQCQCHHFQTNNLLEKFQCRISETLILVNGSEKSSDSTFTPGGYLDIYNGMCCVHSGRKKRADMPIDVFTIRYTISISNNGRTYSDAATIHLFDSKCQQEIAANGEKLFALKDNTCFISGLCRAANETLLTDKCRACLPYYNKHVWADNCYKPNKKESDEKNLGFILGICGGLLVSVIVLMMICIFKRTIGRRMKSVSDAAILDVKPQKEMVHAYPRLDPKLIRHRNKE